MLRLILKNALRQKRRTLLTVLSVAVSIFLLVTMQSVLDMLDLAGEDGEGQLRVVARHKISLFMTLPEAHRAKIEAVPGVEQVGALTWFGGIYIEPKNFFAQFATDPETFREIWTEVEIPDEQWKAFAEERTAAIAGKKLADKFGWKLGDSIHIRGDAWPVDLDLKLRGVFRSIEENQLFFHHKYFDELMAPWEWGDLIGTYWMKVASAEDIPRVTEAVDRMFENSAAPTKTETEKAFQMEFVSMMGNIRALFRNTGLAVAFAILMVAANTMAMSYRERTSEVAVMKTLGFRGGRVLALVLGEAVSIALAGGLLGAGGASLFYRLYNPFEMMFPVFYVTPPTLALGFAVALAVGLLSGGYPAAQASRLSIVDGLRKVV
ncbi:MAG: ABC transporter permease [Acidobacteriota bacterium]|nr:MAG: ABC transporter permease [Acidobacteriota bacterium]